MAKRRAVKVADPRADRAQSGSLALIALGALAIGFSLTLALARGLPRLDSEHAVREVAAAPTDAARVENARESETKSPTPTSAPQPERSAPIVEPRPAPIAVAPSTPVGPQPTATAIAARPEPSLGEERAPAADTKLTARAPAAAKPTAGKRPQRSFEMGSVAYMRCDGLERPGERYPCPRDRPFEEQVWRTLEQLPDCSAADPGRGHAEARLTLRRAAAPSVEIKSTPGGTASLNLRALAKCVSPKLALARTRMRSPHAVVSFRFGLD